MSYYYKYKFVSPEPLFARIKEELKSYFDTGAVDDLLFPVWTDKCLKKLGRSSWKINNVVIFIDNFKAVLPPDFTAVRECWLVACTLGPTFRKPGSFYNQITTTLNKPFDACNPTVNCDPCNPDILTVVTKTNTEVAFPISFKQLLRPGNIAVKDNCHAGCLNFWSDSPDTFDIRDNCIITNFRQGDLYLVYYSFQSDDAGYQLIPDNYRIQEFIEAFIKQKIFEMLSNQLVDETFNQIQSKYIMYKQMADEAYIIADTEVKKKDIYEHAYAIRRDQHRNDPYVRQMYGNQWRWGGWRGGGYPASSWGLND